MWRGRSVSVVLPTYNEKDSIAEVIRGFEALGVVDEIVVVNNNAAPGTPRRSPAPVRVRWSRRPGLRRGDPPRASRGRRRPHLRLRAGRDVRPGGPVQAAHLHEGVRLRRRLADRLDLHLGRRQHGLVPPVRELGRGQDDRGVLQHRRRCPTSAARSGSSPRTWPASSSRSSSTPDRRSGWRCCSWRDPPPCAGRPDPRELPAARRGVVGDRRLPQDAPPGLPDDRDGRSSSRQPCPPLPMQYRRPAGPVKEHGRG